MFSVVDGDDVSDHVRHDDTISKMCFDWGGFLPGHTISFGLFAFEVEPGVLVFEF